MSDYIPNEQLVQQFKEEVCDRSKEHMWAIHNLFAHPLMQILAWFRLYKQAIWIHNITVPKPRGFK
jgi:hypothetical protein